MKSKCPSWRGKAPDRPRCQGRRGMAFIGAKRRPLTEEADGSGAGFSQEGQKGEKTVPLRTYVEGLCSCRFSENGFWERAKRIDREHFRHLPVANEPVRPEP
jgi:hypothetical protein